MKSIIISILLTLQFASPTLSQRLNPKCSLVDFNLAAPTLLETGRFQQITDVSHADLNGDKKQDIIFLGLNETFSYVPMYARNLNPQAGFATAQSIGEGTYYGLDSGDFNRDGRIDVAALSFSGITIFLNQLDGTFLPVAVPHALPGVMQLPQSLIVSDLNRDGALDVASNYLVSVNPNDPYTARRAYTSIFLNNNSPSLFNSSNYLLQNDGGIAGVGSLEVIDLNRDKAPEIVVDNYSRPITYLLRNNGLGDFAVETLEIGAGSQGLKSFDLNQDGLNDLLIGAHLSGSNGAIMMINNGIGDLINGGFQALGGQLLSAADFDLDRLPDYIHSGNGLEFLVEFSKFNGTWRSSRRPFFISIKDHSGDGYPDIVTEFRDSVTHQYSVASITSKPVCRR